jgi:hypothetical protein
MTRDFGKCRASFDVKICLKMRKFQLAPTEFRATNKPSISPETPDIIERQPESVVRGPTLTKAHPTPN